MSVRITPILALQFFTVFSVAKRTDPVPNIVILFVDDMGANQVNVPIARTHGFYSYTGDGGTIHTPNVARLANEGMLFQTWYSGYQVRVPYEKLVSILQTRF